jgi:hypothetical protein
MAGTAIVVLVIMLTAIVLFGLIALAACSRLARRWGQSLKSMSLSPRNGFTVEFYPLQDELQQDRSRGRTQSGPAN